MTIQYINPAPLYDGAPFGMSQATVDTGSGLIFISGQVDWDTNYQVKHAGLAEQAESAAKNLLTVLEAAGSSAGNILQLRVYIRGELGEQIETVAPIVARYFGPGRPALTGIGVASLANPHTLIEIEAVARVTESTPLPR
jgi:2-iminobutanoate/2-iminopropanoate deaminase